MFATWHSQPHFHPSPRMTRLCTHSRIIADVLTPQGLKTGKVRCIECGVVFDDPAPAREQEEDSPQERSIAMRQIYVSLMILGWFAVPNFVSAGWSTSPQISRTDRHTIDCVVIERDSSIRRVSEQRRFENHFDLSLGRDRGRSQSDRERQSDAASSGTGTRSYDKPLGQSFDMPGSVDGHSGRPDPWWGRRPEGEPMLKDLNRDPMRTP